MPLFSGFMYACVGSYLARAWRLFEFRFSRYPPVWATALLAAGAYLNFFTHHFIVDLRWALFAASALLFGRTWIWFRPDAAYRRMPLLLGFVLVRSSSGWRKTRTRHGLAYPISERGRWCRGQFGSGTCDAAELRAGVAGAGPKPAAQRRGDPTAGTEAVSARRVTLRSAQQASDFHTVADPLNFRPTLRLRQRAFSRKPMRRVLFAAAAPRRFA